VSEKLVFMVTKGPADAELVTFPFMMAAAALASDVEVVMGFQGDAVELVRRGGVDGVQAPEFPPLAKLIDSVRELGGKLLLCSPCLKSRGIAFPDDVIDGTEVVAAARFIAEITSATNSLVY